MTVYATQKHALVVASLIQITIRWLLVHFRKQGEATMLVLFEIKKIYQHQH